MHDDKLVNIMPHCTRDSWCEGVLAARVWCEARDV